MLVVAGLLLLPPVQTWTAHRVSAWLAKEQGVTIQIGRIAIHPFGRIALHEVYIADLHGDTLIRASEVRIARLRIHPGTHVVKAGELVLNDARFNLAKDSGDHISNLTHWLESFGAGDTADVGGAPWRMEALRVQVRNLHFTYHDGSEPFDAHGVDFSHVDTRLHLLDASGLRIHGDTVNVHLAQVRLTDQGGLDLLDFGGLAHVSPERIAVDDLRIRTPRSDVHGDLALLATSYDDYDNFEELVTMRLDLDSSLLWSGDIALFASDLKGMDLPVHASGRFRGTVAQLKARDMRLHWGKGSHLRADAELVGLPDFRSTFMLVDVEEMRTESTDIEVIPLPPFGVEDHVRLPEELRALGVVRFTGNFTGFPGSFTAYGRTATALGTLRTDMTYTRDTLSGAFRLAGQVRTDGFNPGPLARTNTLGPLACDLRVQAEGRNFREAKAELDGTVPMFTLNGATVTNITVKGSLERDRFNGALTCDDPNLMLDFKGLADLRGKYPLVDFVARVAHADLVALRLVDGPGPHEIMCEVMAEGELAIDSLKGEALVRNIVYCHPKGECMFGNMDVRSLRAEGRPELQVRSEMFDATVHGPFLPTRLPEAVSSIVFSVFPSLTSEVTYRQEDQAFNFAIDIKDISPILGLLLPELDLPQGAMVDGALDTRTFDISLTATAPRLVYGSLKADSVNIVVDKALDVLAFRVMSSRGTLRDSTLYGGAYLTGTAYQDDIRMDLGWQDAIGGTRAHFALQGEVLGPASAELQLMPSEIALGQGLWRNTEPAGIRWDSSVVQVRALDLHNGRQRVLLDGALGTTPGLSMAFELEDVDLHGFQRFLDGPDLYGRITGEGRVIDVLKKPYLLSYICLDSLHVGREPVGDLRFSANWNEGSRDIAVYGQLQRKTLTALDFEGRFSPGTEDELDIALKLEQFDLRFVEPYLPKEDLSDLQGRVTGTINLKGTLGDPLFTGEVLLEEAGIRINYLNTFYTFTSKAGIRPNMFFLDNVTVRDEEGRTARMGATIVHKAFSKWNYNIWGTMDNLLCLNTSPNENELYYGKAYAMGDIEVSGYAGSLEITVDARTGPGTTIAFPLGGSTEVGGIDFVRFVSASAAADTLEKEIDLTGVKLSLDVDVTPEAKFELIFDPTVGDIMSGSGQGHMEMSVSPAGEFSMRGGVEVTEGDYLFTLKSLLNKRFSLQPGGTITWYGDPFNATLDLNAVYRLRTGLYDIMREKNEAYRKRVPVEVHMSLRDRLMNPVIGFNVKLPTVDDNVRTEVMSVLSNETEVNRQVFALIVFNKFLPPPDQAASASSGNFATTSGSELLSNQVSNWLSQVSDKVDLGVNYRPGDQVTRDEFQVAVSTQILNDRLLVSTNVGVSYGAAQQSNQFIGDFQMEYLLPPRGRMRMKAYSVANDQNLNQNDQAPTTQGAGIGYRIDFNHWSELFRRKKPTYSVPPPALPPAAVEP